MQQLPQLRAAAATALVQLYSCSSSSCMALDLELLLRWGRMGGKQLSCSFYGCRSGRRCCRTCTASPPPPVLAGRPLLEADHALPSGFSVAAGSANGANRHRAVRRLPSQARAPGHLGGTLRSLWVRPSVPVTHPVLVGPAQLQVLRRTRGTGTLGRDTSIPTGTAKCPGKASRRPIHRHFLSGTLGRDTSTPIGKSKCPGRAD